MDTKNNGVLLGEEASDDEDEPAFASIDTGWSWVVLVASFCTFSLMGATQFASGIVYMTLLDRFHANISISSLVGAVHISAISIGAPLSSYASDRYSCRTAIVLSGVLFFVGLVGTAFAPSIEFVLVSYGLVAGIGGALGYTANMVVVVLNFQRRRNLALGIAVAGAGVGICVFATAMQIIYDYYKSTGFFLILAGIYGHIIVFGLVCFPSELELYSKRRRKLFGRKGVDSNSGKKLCMECQGYLIVLKNKPNICLSFGMFMFCLGTYLIYLHLPKYIIQNGFSSLTAAHLVSVSGLVSVFGRLLTGVLASFRVVRDIVIYCCTMYILSIAMFVYPTISHIYAGHLIFSLFLGTFFGNVYVLSSSITAKYVGITNVSKALGLQFFCAGLGALLGPVVAGLIVDLGGTYTQAIIFAACCVLVAGISSNLAPCFSGRVSKTVITDKQMSIIVEQKAEDVFT